MNNHTNICLRYRRLTTLATTKGHNVYIAYDHYNVEGFFVYSVQCTQYTCRPNGKPQVGY